MVYYVDRRGSKLRGLEMIYQLHKAAEEDGMLKKSLHDFIFGGGRRGGW